MSEGSRMSAAESIAGLRKSAPRVERTQKLGIEIPAVWWFGSASPDPEFKPHIRGLELAKLNRLIRDEEMRRRKEWIGILSPIAGWLVALAVLFKDVLIAIFN